MQEYAVFERGSKQYIAIKGDFIKLDRIKDKKVGEEVVFDKVLLYKNDGKSFIGRPYVSNVKVLTEVVEQKRDKKVVVFRYTKKDFRKKRGHRQYVTVVKVKDFVVEN